MADKPNGHDSGLALKLQTLDQFVQRPTVSTLIRGIVPDKSIVVIFGPPKGGKTYSACDLTMHGASGMDWHGCRIRKPLRVVYLAGEGIQGLRCRLKAWLEHHDHLETVPDFRILPLSLSLPDGVYELAQALRPLAPQIIVTDTLNAYFGPGDESSTKDMTVFCDAIRYLRDALGCSIIVIHHTGHGDQGRERGSIVLRATADVLVQVAKDDAGSDLVGFQVIAARDIDVMPAPISLRLTRHVTDWLDDDGEPFVACIVEAGNQPVTLPGRGGRPLGDKQAKLLQAAQELAGKSKPDTRGEVLLARYDVGALAMERGVSKQSVSSAWEPLAKRGYWRLLEPGSIAVKVNRQVQ